MLIKNLGTKYKKIFKFKKKILRKKKTKFMRKYQINPIFSFYNNLYT